MSKTLMKTLTSKQADFLREILDNDGLIDYIQLKRDVKCIRRFLNGILKENKYPKYHSCILNEYGTYYTQYKNK